MAAQDLLAALDSIGHAERPEDRGAEEERESARLLAPVSCPPCVLDHVLQRLLDLGRPAAEIRDPGHQLPALGEPAVDAALFEDVDCASRLSRGPLRGEVGIRPELEQDLDDPCVRRDSLVARG